MYEYDSSSRQTPTDPIRQTPTNPTIKLRCYDKPPTYGRSRYFEQGGFEARVTIFVDCCCCCRRRWCQQSSLSLMLSRSSSLAERCPNLHIAVVMEFRRQLFRHAYYLVLAVPAGFVVSRRRPRDRQSFRKPVTNAGPLLFYSRQFLLLLLFGSRVLSATIGKNFGMVDLPERVDLVHRHAAAAGHQLVKCQIGKIVGPTRSMAASSCSNRNNNTPP
jgi:hypothetical protein